jgi:hypothetical protein
MLAKRQKSNFLFRGGSGCHASMRAHAIIPVSRGKKAKFGMFAPVPGNIALWAFM